MTKSSRREQMVLTGCLHNYIPRKIGGKRPQHRQHPLEFFQMGLVRQITKQQKICNFLKAKSGAMFKSKYPSPAAPGYEIFGTGGKGIGYCPGAAYGAWRRK